MLVHPPKSPTDAEDAQLIRWLIVALVLLLAESSASAVKWCPGIIHVHSTFSDGDRTPAMLKNAAEKLHFSFLITTDHYEQIGSPHGLVAKITKQWGFEKYRQTYQSSGKIVIIAGAEVQTYWGKTASHTLALGDIYETPDISDNQGKKDTQQLIIKNLNNRGYLTVAAHPHGRTLLKNRYWEPFAYLYDKDHAEGIKGIEFFNEDEASYKETRAWYLSLVAAGRDIFVTAGCDSHSSVEPSDAQRWTRITYVLSQLRKNSILEAMRQGHTYVAQNGCYFKSLNVVPGFQFQSVERPSLLCRLGFATGSHKTKIQVYRDGKLVEDSLKKIGGGQKEFSYQWADKQAKAGNHTYVIEIENYLITSPIKIRVLKSAPQPAESQIICGPTKYAGGLPNLLGKTREEVEKAMATTRWVGGYSSVWFMDYYYPVERPRPVHALHVSFCPYQEELANPGDRIHAVGLLLQFDQYDKSLSAKKVIPAEVLSQKPAGIYLCSPQHNVITVIWYINKQTFMAELSDTKPLFRVAKTKDRRGARYYINKNGLDFRNCQRVFSFLCVDDVVVGSKSEEEGIIVHHVDVTGFAYHIYYCPFDK